MGRKLALLFGLLLYGSLCAQNPGLVNSEEPLEWNHFTEKLSDSTYLLVMEAEILPGWHLYSQFSDPNGGMPAEFEFEKAGVSIRLDGGVEESKTNSAYNDIFEVDETFFEHKARFTQKITVIDTSLTQIRAFIYYQICAQVCIPGEQEFLFSLTGVFQSENEATPNSRDKVLGEALKLDLKNRELLQDESNGVQGVNEKSLWGLFGLGFIGGLIALLTPCVFPMIPLTVSFFTKHSGSRKKGIASALFYGFSIVLIYVLLSLPFHVFDGTDSQLLNAMATNVWLNLFFFLIFLVFAFSFFGFYELTLPSKWASSVDSASSKTEGFIGIFFMALTLAIVSFSCTGPILGGLLGSTALSAGNVALNLTVGMTGFGLALALPFGLFALFPTWLQHLPKSGGWMDTVKAILGFLELGLALKFLSNADLVGHWGILKREVFLAVWILISLVMAGYLFGLFKSKSARAELKSYTWQKIAGLFSTIFAGYLIYGLVTREPLKLLSGFPPPDFYSLVESNSECPLGLECVKDFEQGLEVSRATGKPILLDFTGWACVNCRKMEEQVWSAPEVYEMLKQDFILVSLYVDDRKKLPEDQQFDFYFQNGKRKRIRTVGDLWSTFQTINFGSLSQPYYVQLSSDLKVLNHPLQNSNAATYTQWLKEGLKHLEASKFQF